MAEYTTEVCQQSCHKIVSLLYSMAEKSTHYQYESSTDWAVEQRKRKYKSL